MHGHARLTSALPLTVQIVPDTMYTIFQSTIHSGGTLPPTGTDTWLAPFATFGIMYVGAFYLTAARHNLREIFVMTVWARLLVLPLVHCLLVYFGRQPFASLETFVPLTALHMWWSFICDRARLAALELKWSSATRNVRLAQFILPSF